MVAVDQWITDHGQAVTAQILHRTSKTVLSSVLNAVRLAGDAVQQQMQNTRGEAHPTLLCWPIT